ncbi:MAG: DUF6887 family protein [Microcystaceae cyanobacterium]
MSKLNFQAMSRKYLQAYFLAHRDDEEAFYAYVDRLHAEANWVEMLPLQSLEDLENYPEFLKRLRNSPETRDKAVD